jgi:ABC-type multidrug transport system ATPase subunit
MASLLIPDQGSCAMQGFDVVSQYRKVRKIIGYMPGRFSLYMDLSVEENLAFYAGVFGTTLHENYDLVKEVYGQIEPFKKRQAGKLSGGMKQKLALSCALIHRPQVLILDEPTTGVDAVSRREFWELLKGIQSEGITIVVSTPYMDEAELCDRVALIQKGKILDISDPSEVGEGHTERLYALSSSKGVYAYLKKIRSLEGCQSAWLSGDEIHVMLRSDRDSQEIDQARGGWNDPTITWKQITPSIEDRFIGLMQRAEHD